MLFIAISLRVSLCIPRFTLPNAPRPSILPALYESGVVTGASPDFLND